MMSWILLTWINYEVGMSWVWIMKGVGFKGWYE